MSLYSALRCLTGLHHSTVIFLKSLTKALLGLQILVDAFHGAALFLSCHGSGREIVHTVVETGLNHFGIGLVT